MWLRICLIIFFSSSPGPALVSPVCDSVASQSVHSEPHPTAGSGSVPTGGHSRTLVSRILPYANQLDYDSDIDLVGDWENQCRPRPTSAGLDDISVRAARSGFLWDGVALKPVEELSPMQIFGFRGVTPGTGSSCCMLEGWGNDTLDPLPFIQIRGIVL